MALAGLTDNVEDDSLRREEAPTMVADGSGDWSGTGASVSVWGRAAALSGILFAVAMIACETLPAPETPANQRYGAVGSTVVLNWDYSADAESYTIYYGDPGCRLDSGQPVFCTKLASDVWETRYAHQTPGPGANDYWVVACNESGCSEIDTANPARRLPGTPENVRVVQEGTSLRVTWDPVEEATRYKVYHSDGRAFCSSGDGTPYCSELDGDVVGTSYAVDPPVPRTPDFPRVVDRTSDALTVYWSEGDNIHYYWVSACGDAGCSPIVDGLAASIEVHTLYYKIYRIPRDGTEGDEVIEYTPDEFSLDRSRYVDKGLRPDAVYYYRVAACNDNGCSIDDDSGRRRVAESAAAGLTESDGPVDAPSAPALQGKKIEISGGGDDAKVTWDSMEGATYYELWKGSDPSRTFELAGEISAPLEFQSYATPVNRAFFGEYSVTSWKVKACNKTGCSPFSNVVTIR